MGSAFKRGEKVIVPAIIQVRDDGSVASLPTSHSTALTEKPSGARAFKPGDKVIADSLFQVKDDGSTDQDSSGLVNPLTGLGDLIIGGIAGALRRLAPTTVGQVLTLVAPGVPAWAAASGGGGGAGTPNVDYARIIRSAAFTLNGDSLFHTFPFDTVVEDGNSLWSAADTGFKIKTAGTYVISWEGPYQAGAGMRNGSALFVNGIAKAKSDFAANYDSKGAVSLRLAVNDIVTLQYFANANNAIITGQDPQINYLSIVRAGNDGSAGTISDYAVMYRTAAFAMVGDGAWHLLPVDTVDIDGNTLSDTVNSRFVIKVAGRYQVSGQLQFNAAGVRTLASIFVDSGAGPVLRKRIADSPGGGLAASTALLNLGVGDKVYLYYLAVAAGQSLYVADVPPSVANWFSLSKLP